MTKKRSTPKQIAKALGADKVIPVTAASVHRLSKRVTELETAIRAHRDAKGHQRCWLNDEELYRVLKDKVNAAPALPPRGEFLTRCAEYYDRQNQRGMTPDDEWSNMAGLLGFEGNELPSHEDFLGACEEFFEHRIAVTNDRKGVKPLEKIVGDTCYELDRPMLEGALAMMAGISYHANPYHVNSTSHDQWNYGHELADADEEDERLTEKEVLSGLRALGLELKPNNQIVERKVRQHFVDRKTLPTISPERRQALLEEGQKVRKKVKKRLDKMTRRAR